VQWYLQQKLSGLMSRVAEAKTYKDWFWVAEEKSRLDLLAIQSEIELDTAEINAVFQKYALEQFGKLSSSIDKDTPVLVSKAMGVLMKLVRKLSPGFEQTGEAYAQKAMNRVSVYEFDIEQITGKADRSS